MNKVTLFYITFSLGLIVHMGSVIIGVVYYPDYNYNPSPGIKNIHVGIIFGAMIVGTAIGIGLFGKEDL